MSIKIKEQENKFRCEFINQVSKEIIFGIDFLHSNSIIHRDIQPELASFVYLLNYIDKMIF